MSFIFARVGGPDDGSELSMIRLEFRDTPKGSIGARRLCYGELATLLHERADEQTFVIIASLFTGFGHPKMLECLHGKRSAVFYAFKW